MARIRFIKPGIMTNEDLGELGKDAYILFTGLWMLADREGRFEWRPKRIKMEAMPLWDDCDWKTVEKLLESMAEKHFIHKYEVDGKVYGQIVNWRKHQHPHPREAASEIPPMKADSSLHRKSVAVNGRSVNKLQEAMPRHVQGNAKARTRQCLGTVEPGGLQDLQDLRNRRRRGSHETSNGSKSRPVEKPTTTTPKLTPKPNPALRPQAAPRKPPQSEGLPPADLSLVHESLKQLATAMAMPPPDVGVAVQVIAAAGGAPGEQIHAVLVELWKRQKFRNMYSWGLVPKVVGQQFTAA